MQSLRLHFCINVYLYIIRVYCQQVYSSLIINTSNHRKRIIPIYGYLLSENRKKELEKMVKTDAKLDQMMGVINDKEQRLQYEGTILKPEEIISRLAGLNIQFKKLIADELEATYKEFKGLSLIK